MLKLLACNIFMREACHCIARSPHVIDVEFTELGEHAQPSRLRDLLQEKIDAVERSAKSYDALLLLFGVCGNATIGLQARSTKLVIPRAHDCCTILLGSRHAFAQHFKDAPSTPFSSAGYLERGNYFLRLDDSDSPSVHPGDAYAQLVAQYGEDDAKYIWQTMHPDGVTGHNNHAVFIELPQTAPLGHRQRFAEKAAAEGKSVKLLPGNIHLIQNLLFGQWNPDEFLIVNPGQKTSGVYDFHEILRAQNP